MQMQHDSGPIRFKIFPEIGLEQSQNIARFRDIVLKLIGTLDVSRTEVALALTEILVHAVSFKANNTREYMEAMYEFTDNVVLKLAHKLCERDVQEWNKLKNNPALVRELIERAKADTTVRVIVGSPEELDKLQEQAESNPKLTNVGETDKRKLH
jgi:hypothetical protein